MERIILHLDMDAFFAQIEERENPRFKGKPLVVGSDPKEGKGRGVVATANYEARKYGIHSALPISQAFRLCPGAVFLPPNHEFYVKVSEKIMGIAEKYSPLFEVRSLDEAFLDLSFAGDFCKAEDLAKKLKKEILEKEKLTCTAGIGPNKLISKMAASSAKPDGLLTIRPEQVQSFLDPLNVSKIPGIGPKTEERLKTIKVRTVKDLRSVSQESLKGLLGKNGLYIYECARGMDEDPVSQAEAVKSIGRSKTFEEDTRDAEIIFSSFEEMMKEVFKEAEVEAFSFRTLTATCRFSGFETKTKSLTVKSGIIGHDLFEKEAKKILLRLMMESSKLVRMIGFKIQ